MKTLKALESVHLDFSECKEFASVDGLGKFFASLPVLTFLVVNLSLCQQLTSIDEFGRGFSFLLALRRLNLQFGNDDEDDEESFALGPGVTILKRSRGAYRL